MIKKLAVMMIFIICFVLHACYVLNQYDSAPDNEESAKTAEIARQGEREESNTDSIVKTVSPQAPADSTPSTAEKPITETPLTKDIEPTQAQPEVLAKPAETTDVQVSPNSFGHYPQIPKEMGVPKDKVKIFWENVSVNPRHELLFRVRN